MHKKKALLTPKKGEWIESLKGGKIFPLGAGAFTQIIYSTKTHTYSTLFSFALIFSQATSANHQLPAQGRTWSTFLPNSVTSEWQPEISHNGSIYTSEIGICYQSGLFFFFQKTTAKHVPPYHQTQETWLQLLKSPFCDLAWGNFWFDDYSIFVQPRNSLWYQTIKPQLHN